MRGWMQDGCGQLLDGYAMAILEHTFVQWSLALQHTLYLYYASHLHTRQQTNMVKKAAAHSALRRYIEPEGRKGMPEHSFSEERKQKTVSEVPATTEFGVVDIAV